MYRIYVQYKLFLIANTEVPETTRFYLLTINLKAQILQEGSYRILSLTFGIIKEQ